MLNLNFPADFLWGADTGLKTSEKTATPEDKTKAVRLADTFINRRWLDPMYLGRYPEELWVGEDLSMIKSGDMEIINTRPRLYGCKLLYPLRYPSGLAQKSSLVQPCFPG